MITVTYLTSDGFSITDDFSSYVEQLYLTYPSLTYSAVSGMVNIFTTCIRDVASEINIEIVRENLQSNIFLSEQQEREIFHQRLLIALDKLSQFKTQADVIPIDKFTKSLFF